MSTFNDSLTLTRMTSLSRKIIGWTPVVLVSLFLLGASAFPKLFLIEPGNEMYAFTEQLGVQNIYFAVGILEALIAILLFVPRTSTIGFILAIGLLGGAMSTGLTHEAPGNWPFFPLIIIALLMLSAYFRNPELLSRVLKRPVPQSSKWGRIFAWVLTILVVAFHLPALYFKYFPMMDEASVTMRNELGLNLISEPILGIVQALCVILLLIPRTATIGFILMIGYTGGILANFLTHGYSPVEASMFFIVLAVLTVAAYFRSPELLSRLKGDPVPEKI